MNHNVPVNKSVRRKGVTIAAAALSVALVAPFAQSVAFPEITAAAQAQDARQELKLKKNPPVYYADDDKRGGETNINGSSRHVRSTGILAGTYFPIGTKFELADPSYRWQGFKNRGWYGWNLNDSGDVVTATPGAPSEMKSPEVGRGAQPYVVEDTGQILFGLGPRAEFGSRQMVPMRATYSKTDSETGKVTQFTYLFEQGIQVGDAPAEVINPSCEPGQIEVKPPANLSPEILGQSKTKATEIEVQESSTTTPPTLDGPIFAGQTKISGGADGTRHRDRATITVKIPGLDPVTTTAGIAGNWSVSIPSGVTLVDGQDISVTRTTTDGVESLAVKAKVGDSKIGIAPPTVTPVVSGANTISGSRNLFAPVYVQFPGKDPIWAGPKEDGTYPKDRWTLEVPSDVDLKPGQKILVTSGYGGITLGSRKTEAVPASTTASNFGFLYEVQGLASQCYEKDEIPKENPSQIDLSVNPEGNIAGQVGQPIEPVAVNVTNQPEGTKVQVDGLPEGLVYNPESKQIEGTPKAKTLEGGTEATIRLVDAEGNPVKDASGENVSSTVRVTISPENAKPPVVSDTLGYPDGTIQISADDEGTARKSTPVSPNLPDSIAKEEGDKYQFGNDLPEGFAKDPNNPNRIIKDGAGDGETPDDSSDDVVVTIDPDTGEIAVEAGDKGDTNGPKDIPVEYVGEDGTVKGKDSVSIDVKPRPDLPSDSESPANGLKYPEDEIAIGANDSGAQRTKESGVPEISDSVTKENDDIFRFHKDLPPGFERVDDDETRVKFDGGTPDDENDDVDLTIDRKTGKVTVVGGENAKAKADIPVELIDKDGVPKDSGVISVNVTPEKQQTPPPATDDEGKGLNYPQNLHVAPDNYKRSDSTGEPNLPESLKEDGATFRFGPNLPEGFVVNPNPSWHGVEELVRNGDGDSKQILLRLNKQNGKVEVHAGADADYANPELSIEYIGVDNNVKGKDTVSVTVRPIAHSWNGNPSEAQDGIMTVPYTGSKEDEAASLIPTVTQGSGSATLSEDGDLNYNPGADDKPGDQIEVTISDANGDNIRKVGFKLPSTDAADYEPEGRIVIVAQGGNPDAAEGIANKGELPEGTEFEFDGPVDTSTPGDKPVKVIVSYPDGSTEAVEVTVQVAAGDQDLLPDADRYEPEAKDGVTTSEGETPEAGALIDNKGDLPAGTTFEWEIEPNVDVPGNTGGVVKVIYPDGSSETIAVELEVTEVPTDADGHDPQGQNLEVAEGGELDPADAITNKGELPESTEFEFDGPVDTSTPGDKPAKVIVGYPDGSTDSVETTVTVTEVATQADEFEPKGKTVIVAHGGNPDAAEGIANKGELPEGTEFEFDGPVDTSTPGDKSAKVIVGYPDGSTETVEVTVQVAAGDQDLLPDNERYEPQWNDTTIEDNSPVTVENKGDELPHGTEVELGWGHGGLNQGTDDWELEMEENGDITVTPGSDAQPGDAIMVEVEINYPDGNSETKTFVVQVQGDRDAFAPGNFGELPPLTGGNDDDLTADDIFTEAPTVNPVNPGDNIISGTGKPGATITVTGPNGFSTTTTVHENGQWSVDLTGGATPGTQFIVSQKDGDKNESDQVLVTVGGDNKPLPNPGSSELPGSSLGSSNFDIPKHLQCAVFAGGVTAIPLILLSPMHNMYEMMINPHLNGLREQFHRELHALDQQVRRGLGVEGHPALQFMDHINARVNEFNQQLGQVAHDNRHIGLAAAAIAVAGLSFQHCMNTQAASSSSVSLVGSSSSSQEQAPARNEAKEDNAGGIVGWFQGLFNRK